MTTYRIVAPHFVADVVSSKPDHYGDEMTAVITKTTAPIVDYMRGWSVGQMHRYCVRKGWHIAILLEKQDRERLCVDCKHYRASGEACVALRGQVNPVDGKDFSDKYGQHAQLMRATVCGWKDPKLWEPK